jgi:hypothetical protein
MLAILLAALALATAQPDAGRSEASIIVERIERAHAAHETLADTLFAASAEERLMREILDDLGAGAPWPEDLHARLQAVGDARQARLDAASEKTDFEALTGEERGAIVLVKQLALHTLDAGLAADLADIARPHAGSSGLTEQEFEMMERSAALLADHEPPVATAPPDPALLASFDARFETWAPLARELGGLFGRDQLARFLWSGETSADIDPGERRAVNATLRLVERVDRTNMARVEQLLDEMSFNDIHSGSETVADLIAMIVHHAGSQAQKRALLTQIEPLAREGAFSGSHYALMHDRVARADGGLQRYGTQASCGADGQFVIADVEDPEDLDERRSRMGLDPMDDYLARLRQMYGRCG